MQHHGDQNLDDGDDILERRKLLVLDVTKHALQEHLQSFYDSALLAPRGEKWKSSINSSEQRGRAVLSVTMGRRHKGFHLYWLNSGW